MDSQSSSVFTFGIDETAQLHFISIAKWNRFMAIVGIAAGLLSILVIVIGGGYFLSNLYTFGGGTGGVRYAQGGFTGTIIFYVFLMSVFVVPCFFRLGFSNKMLRALASSDQELLNESLRQLKIYSKYWGVLTIIIIGFYVLVFIVLIISFLVAGNTRF